MATPWELAAEGALEAYVPDLDPGELAQRHIYFHPKAADWLRAVLPSAQSDEFVAGAMTPEQQLDDLLSAFCSGEPMPMPPHVMEPDTDWVWTMRTPDLRLYGWFWKVSHFVVGSVCLKASIASGGIAASGFVEETKWRRNALALDEPKYIEGRIDDEFSH